MIWALERTTPKRKEFIWLHVFPTKIIWLRRSQPCNWNKTIMMDWTQVFSYLFQNFRDCNYHISRDHLPPPSATFATQRLICGDLLSLSLSPKFVLCICRSLFDAVSGCLRGADNSSVCVDYKIRRSNMSKAQRN